MTNPIRLVLTIHNHQPIGNFSGVFEEAYATSYAPFLELIEQFPEIPLSLHTSGSLLEWLVEARPDYIARVRELVQRGQVEILGGPFFEPILACIPRHDRIGQIQSYGEYLGCIFGTRVRGMWVPERVWEQTFAGDVTRAGIEYTILDDYHFKNAGIPEDRLFGYYLTEDEGRVLKVFPGSERLRYTIPFAEPHESIEYLRQVAHDHPHAVVAFGDDGEKFGSWPETYKHVYEDGWLRRFFELLRENLDWITVSTLGTVVDEVSPIGRVYLPDCSYREMTEWALETDRQRTYHQLVESRQHDHDWSTVKSFLRGGFWRNFRAKYPESNEMYTRMLEVSNRLQACLADDHLSDNQAELLEDARTALFRAQCNCPYWHGTFGGLYLPHLRNAVYQNLITADNLIEQAQGRTGRWVEVATGDYTLNARKDVRLAGDRLIAYLQPSCGGHLYELDLRSVRHNLLATLNRRPEPYHDVVRRAAEFAQGGETNGGPRFKHADLDKKLAYDEWPRKSLVDHFLTPGLSLDDFRLGHGLAGDFVSGPYDTVVRRSEERVEVRLFREGQCHGQPVRVTKTIGLSAGSAKLEITYQLEGLAPGSPVHFAVEFNFAGMAAGQEDRYFFDDRGRTLGPLETVQDLEPGTRIGLADEWAGLVAALEFSIPTGVWTFPIQTISQSEGGYELVHQSSCVVPHWQFTADETGSWSVRIVHGIDTSAAQARLLRDYEAAIGEPA